MATEILHEKDHPCKFGEILLSGLGGDVVWIKLLIDDGGPMITQAHIEPMAQMS